MIFQVVFLKTALEKRFLTLLGASSTCVCQRFWIKIWGPESFGLNFGNFRSSNQKSRGSGQVGGWVEIVWMLGTWEFDFSKQPSSFGFKVAKSFLKTFASKVFEEKTKDLADPDQRGSFFVFRSWLFNRCGRSGAWRGLIRWW